MPVTTEVGRDSDRGEPEVVVRALLFTDSEGSTALVRRLGEGYGSVLYRHCAIIGATAVERSGWWSEPRVTRCL
jgi:hypothetical protein